MIALFFGVRTSFDRSALNVASHTARSARRSEALQLPAVQDS